MFRFVPIEKKMNPKEIGRMSNILRSLRTTKLVVFFHGENPGRCQFKHLWNVAKTVFKTCLKVHENTGCLGKLLKLYHVLQCKADHFS